MACINVNNLDAKQVQQKAIEILEGHQFAKKSILNFPDWYLEEKDESNNNQLQLSEK